MVVQWQEDHKLSVSPKQIPTEAIVSSVEAVLSRQHELSKSIKDNIRSRMTSTLQFAMKRLKTDENIVILPSEKGQVSVVLNMTDYND